MNPYRSEEDLISYWLDLAGESWGEYAWAAPGTWATLAQPIIDDPTSTTRGDLGEFNWISPRSFTVKILMNPFAEEGRLYLAHSGTKYLAFVNL